MPVIRPATEVDIPGILELYQELNTGPYQLTNDRIPSVEECRRVFAEICEIPGHELVVAEESGNIIGTLVLLIVPNLSHGALPWALVENMVVTRAHRHEGVGKSLMEYALQRAREAGCYKTTLSSNKKRRGAHRFYRSVGFEPSAVGFRHYFQR